jgi:hypothetical protein
MRSIACSRRRHIEVGDSAPSAGAVVGLLEGVAVTGVGGTLAAAEVRRPGGRREAETHADALAAVGSPGRPRRTSLRLAGRHALALSDTPGRSVGAGLSRALHTLALGGVPGRLRSTLTLSRIPGQPVGADLLRAQKRYALAQS